MKVNEGISPVSIKSIISVAIITFGGIVAETAMNVSFPSLMQTFQIDLNVVQWVTTAFLLSVTISVTTSAYLSKKVFARYLWLFTLSLFAIGSLTAGFANIFAVLIIGRVLQGIALGIAMSLMFNLIMALVPKNKIGLWMGIAGTVVALAPSLGPTYGGALVVNFGWRAIFWLLILIPVLSFMIGWRNLNMDIRQPNQEDIKFDICAFLLLTITLTSVIIFVNKLENGAINLTLLLVTLVSLSCFIWRSLTSKIMFLNIRLLAKRRFITVLLPVGIWMFANLGMNLLITNYLESVIHLSSFLSGFALLPGALVAALMTPYFGRLYDLRGAQFLLLLGNIIIVIAVIFMLITLRQLTFFPMLIIYFVLAIGITLSYSAGETETVHGSNMEHQADATAILQAFQMFMGALGVAVSALLGSHSGNITVGFQKFLLLILGLLIFVFALLWIRNPKKK